MSSWYDTKRAHSTIEKEGAELTTHSACVTWGGAEVYASQSSRLVKSSRLEKSSWYNRKSVSIASHTKCMHHLRCSSKAALGNMVKFSRVQASEFLIGRVNSKQGDLGTKEKD